MAEPKQVKNIVEIFLYPSDIHAGDEAFSSGSVSPELKAQSLWTNPVQFGSQTFSKAYIHLFRFVSTFIFCSL